MEKKPITMLVKDAHEAAKRLNELVEKGAYEFDFGITDEYVTTVTKNSDGTTERTKEKHFRITGFANTYVGEELDSLNNVREDMKKIKNEREEMNRTLDVMNKSPFAPISIFLLGVGLVTEILGLLTSLKVLPIPEAQFGIAIALCIVGVLAIGGSIGLCLVRNNKRKVLLTRKDEIEKENEALKSRELEIDSRVPQWYKDALWTAEGDVLKSAIQTHNLVK